MSDFALYKQKPMTFPSYIFVSDNYYDKNWDGDRRIKNSIISMEEKILFKKPSNFSEPLAKLEKGRLLVIKKCDGDWCNVTTNDYKGWIQIKNVWGSTK